MLYYDKKYNTISIQYYLMNNLYIIALIIGIFVKIYDDIHDLNIKIEPFIDESLKVIITSLTALLSYNNYIVGLSIFAGLIAVILSDIYTIIRKETQELGSNETYWYSVIFAGLIGSIFGYSNNINVSIKDIFTVPVFIFAIIYGLFIIIEPKYFPEETSKNKMIFRGAFTLINILILMCIIHYNIVIPDAIIYSIITMIGYSGTSTVIQYYLSQENVSIPSIKS